MRCRGESGLGIAITEPPVADEVGVLRWVQQGRICGQRRLGIDHRAQRTIIHHDPFDRVLGGMAVRRESDRDRLAGIAHAVGRKAAMLDRGFDRDGEGKRPPQRVLAR